MTEIKTRAFTGIVGLTLAGLLSVGCSSSNNTTGTAGTSGSAGSGAGTAGTTGTGNTTGTAGTTGTGNTTGTAGTTGSGGSSACAAPTTKLISDFTADAGTGLSTSTPFTFQDSGLAVPMVDTSTGALKVTFNTGVASTMYPYAGVGVPFDACHDLSSSTGIKFNITGTLNTGCTIQFSLVDEKHSNSGTLAMCGIAKGTTTDSCYPGGKIFTLPSTATDVTINFADIPQGGTGGDATVGATVPSLATGVQWQLNVPSAEAGSGCTGDITIDNITLVP